MKNRLSSVSFAVCVAGCLLATANVAMYAQVDLGQVEVGAGKAERIAVSIPTARTLESIAVVTGGVAHLDYLKLEGGSCAPGNAYRANTVCTVNVEFAPHYPGARNGAIVLRDQYEDIIGITYLHGTGMGSQAAFLPGRQAKVSDGFSAPGGLAVDGGGNFYVAQNLFFPDPYAGGDPVYGSVTKGSLKAGQNSIGHDWVDPTSVAVDGAGNAFVSDFIGGIWKLTLRSDKSYTQTLAVSGGDSVAVDGSGNLYTIEVGTDLYKESLQLDGSYLPARLATGFVSPTAIAVDAPGNLYVTDAGNPFASGGATGAALYKETLAKGKYVRTVIGKGWIQPSAVAVDGLGNVYVNDSGTIYKETLLADGRYTQSTILSKLAQPGCLAVNGAGDVFVTENTGIGAYGLPSYGVFRLEFAHPLGITFDNTKRGATSDDGPKSVTVTNAGNKPLNFWEVRYPTDFPESRSGVDDCTVRTRLTAGESCSLTVDFRPLQSMGQMKSLPLAESVRIVSDSLNRIIAEETVQVSGTEIPQGPIGTPKH
jgi:hypothetical protein